MNIFTIFNCIKINFFFNLVIDKDNRTTKCNNKGDDGCNIFQDLDEIVWSNLPQINTQKYKELYYPKDPNDQKLIFSFKNLQYSNNDYGLIINYWSRIQKEGTLNIKYNNINDTRKSIESVFKFDLKSNSGPEPETITFNLSDFLAHFGSDFNVEIKIECKSCEDEITSNFVASISKPEKTKSKFSISNSHEYLEIFKDQSAPYQWKSLVGHFIKDEWQFNYTDRKSTINLSYQIIN